MDTYKLAMDRNMQMLKPFLRRNVRQGCRRDRQARTIMAKRNNPPLPTPFENIVRRGWLEIFVAVR